MRSALLAILLASAASAQPQPAAVERHPFACHHHAIGTKHEQLQEEIDRLQQWLAAGDHRGMVLADPLAIAQYHALKPDQGGPRSPQIRWFPHWVRAAGEHWETPAARLNPIAVPLFPSTELYTPPGSPDSKLLEYLPLAIAEAGRDRAEEVVVRGGLVEQFPASEGDHDPDARRRARIQVRAERALFTKPQAGAAAGRSFVTFDALSDWSYQDGLRGAPPAVRAFDGKPVVMVGRLVPEDPSALERFLLVRDPWSDDWGRRPRVHEIVWVHAPKGSVELTTEPLRVTGTLRVREERDGDLVVGIYRLDAERVEVLK